MRALVIILTKSKFQYVSNLLFLILFTNNKKIHFMQKQKLLLTLLLLFSFGFSWAKNENLQLNEQQLQQDFKEIDKIEAYVQRNEGISYEELQKQQIFDLNAIQLEKSVASFAINDDDPLLGIPAFWWGCCLGIIGVVLVIIMTDNDKALVRKSLKGFLTAIGVAVGLYVIYIVVVLSIVANSGV